MPEHVTASEEGMRRSVDTDETTSESSTKEKSRSPRTPDDTALYERSDWPLSNHVLPNQPWIDVIEKDFPVPDAGEWVDEPDVSDLEDHPVRTEVEQEAGAERRNSWVGSDDELEPATPVAGLESRMSRIHEHRSPRQINRQSTVLEPELAQHDSGRISPVASAPEQITADHRSSHSAVSTIDEPEEVLEQTRASPPSTGVRNETSSHLGGPSEEQFDATPPLLSEQLRRSPDLPRSSTQSPASRRPSDTPRHARHSSAAKAFHSRQSSYNTTHVPSNRDRVRYSWQSVHEEDSGKPRIHVIKLVSNNASASSAFPQGEAFGFSISPSGRRIAAYNSARLFILQTAALPVGISQDFSLKRRPLAVELNDSGSLVAILADEHTINVYDLSQSKLKRVKTLKLDFPTSSIAIAPCGGLLAAAYENGIEVFSLATSALPTDRRAVRSPKMDRLTFSDDGSTLLGTTMRIHASSTVIVNVPIFPSAPNNVPTSEELKIAWCSELLHPGNIRNSSHAAFMREERAVKNEHIFAWNGLADTFGILNAGDLEYGSVEFPLVVSPPLSTCGGLGAAVHSCPAVDEFGDTVAMIVNDRTIRLYMVPQVGDELDIPVEAHSIDHELDDGYGCPFHEVKWVHSPAALPTPIRSHAQPRGRLLVTSPGGVYSQEQIEDSFDEIEGGRIILFDFDPQFAGQPGQTFVLNLGKSPPQPLPEEEYDVADAVALVRRRTVKQSNAEQARPISLGRAATTMLNSPRRDSRPASIAVYSRRTASILSVGSSQTDTSRSLPDLMEGLENGEALEEPFSNQAPRSQASLQRAASNAQRHRFQSIEERHQENTTTDSAFLPLPEYTEEPNAPLPSRFRAMAGLDTNPNPSARFSGPLNSHNVPMSAPLSTGEHFSADRAFATANASATAMYNQRGAPMPRGLLRAYSNANHMIRPESHPSRLGASSNFQSIDEHFSDPFSPAGSSEHVSSPMTISSNSMIARAYDNRFSTPLSTIADYQTSLPRRSSSTRRPGETAYGASRNYNMQAFRQASATASLFPPTQSSDHLPLPTRMQATGNVAHPITNWRPPVPSVVIPPQSPGHGSRGHSRKSSLASKSAFASTDKARRLGFFKKKSSGRNAGPYGSKTADDAMMDDSKSMMTWNTASERKCILM